MRDVYVLRDDLDVAAPWIDAAARRSFVETLASALEGCAAGDVEVRVVSVADQQLVFDEWADGGVQAVSLDPFVYGHWTLGVSRVFLPARLGSQACALRLAERPGGLPFGEQLAGLPAGDVVLVDDDIATGSTMRAVTEMIGGARPDVRVVGWRSLLGERTFQAGEAGASDTVFDVVDARDFLWCARHGGLVVADGVRVFRASYLSPDVDLTYRARLDPSRIDRFLDVMRPAARKAGRSAL